jgi:hypothetical protein
MDATVETVLVVGLAWMAFKGLVTVLLLLGAGRVLRRTPLAPLVVRMEAHPYISRLRSRLPWSRPVTDADPNEDHSQRPSDAARQLWSRVSPIHGRPSRSTTRPPTAP